VSASFKYSNFDIYCSENNVSIAPRIISDHFSYIKQIVPTAFESFAVNETQPGWTSCADGIALPRAPKENRNVCNAFNHLPAACCQGETRQIYKTAFPRLGA
jgi:hypothetical protein